MSFRLYILMVEYFRDVNEQDILLLMDNIYFFVYMIWCENVMLSFDETAGFGVWMGRADKEIRNWAGTHVVAQYSSPHFTLQVPFLFCYLLLDVR